MQYGLNLLYCFRLYLVYVRKDILVVVSMTISIRNRQLFINKR